jgi:predicted house-cleaning noncanonical NTP pyrophosphatase (MazG superfamily)
MFERQTGVYIGSKIPQVLRKAIQHAVMSGSYLNSSDFRDAIKEKLQLEVTFYLNNLSGKLVIAMSENKPTKQINNLICGMMDVLDQLQKKLLFHQVSLLVSVNFVQTDSEVKVAMRVFLFQNTVNGLLPYGILELIPMIIKNMLRKNIVARGKRDKMY